MQNYSESTKTATSRQSTNGASNGASNCNKTSKDVRKSQKGGNKTNGAPHKEHHRKPTDQKISDLVSRALGEKPEDDQQVAKPPVKDFDEDFRDVFTKSGLPLDSDAQDHLRESLARVRDTKTGPTRGTLLMVLSTLLTNIQAVLAPVPATQSTTSGAQTDDDADASATDDATDDTDEAFAQRVLKQKTQKARLMDAMKVLATTSQITSNTQVSFENPTKGSGFFHCLVYLLFATGGRQTSAVIHENGASVVPEIPKWKTNVMKMFKAAFRAPLFRVNLTYGLVVDLLSGWQADYGIDLTETQSQDLINALCADFRPALADDKASVFYLPQSFPHDDDEPQVCGWFPVLNPKPSLETNKVLPWIHGMKPPSEDKFTYVPKEMVSAATKLNLDSEVMTKEITGKTAYASLLLQVFTIIQTMMNTRRPDIGGAIALNTATTLATYGFLQAFGGSAHALTFLMMCSFHHLVPIGEGFCDKLSDFATAHAQCMRTLKGLRDAKDLSNEERTEMDRVKSLLITQINKLVLEICLMFTERLKINGEHSFATDLLRAYLEKDILDGALKQTYQDHLAQTAPAKMMANPRADKTVHKHTDRMPGQEEFPGLPQRKTIPAPSTKTAKIPASESKPTTTGGTVESS